MRRDPAEELWYETTAAFQRGDLDAAKALSHAVLAESPGHAQALHGLALIECRLGRLTEAVPLFQESLRLDPTNATAHFNLGVVLGDLGQPAAAVVSHRQALTLQPEYAEAWSSLAANLSAQGEYAAAVEAARQALHLAPHFVAASANLAVALRGLGDETTALETILLCVRRNPESAEAWFWMGQALHLRGELTAAIGAYERAITLDPGHILAHARRGIAWLTTGDFVRGWPEYEWRLRSPGAAQRRFFEPRWSGDSLAGRTILLQGEQGLGDTIQMLRYVAPLADRAARVIVEVDTALLPLVPQRDNVMPLARGGEPPPFDVYCPLFSLPLAFGTTLETIPGLPSYLRPDPARVNAWKQMLPSAGPRRRIGIVWAGSRRHQQDRDRSLSLETLAPLFGQPDIAWFSLQVGPAAIEADTARLTNLAPQLHDFGETAAAITQLDLVITVDTAVAHLAGALGVPVWILLASPAEWRWLLDRDDSPWYPSARIFRQRTPGDWPEVIARVTDALVTHPTGAAKDTDRLAQLEARRAAPESKRG